MAHSDDRELLAGGNVAAEVWRMGDAVRRPAGTWTPTIHALLAHLERVGFNGAPRVLGFDEDGREMLDRSSGTVPLQGGASDGHCLAGKTSAIESRSAVYTNSEGDSGST